MTGTWVRPVRRRAALLIGALAGLVSVAASSVPSYWGDEAASVLSAQRSIPGLVEMLERVDAVHGVYYVFLHFWIGLFGTSEFAVRLPSAIAIGAAAAGTVVLGTRLAGRTTGIIAGTVFAVLPIVTYFGVEARSYAFAIAASVWLIVFLISLVRNEERRWTRWAWFAVAFAAAIHLFVYLVLLAAVGLVVVMVYRPTRAVVLRWLVASAGALVIALPFILVCVSQRGQVAFLARRNYATAESVLAGQWFGGTPWFAVVAWSLILAAVVTSVLVPSSRRAVLIAATWAAVPTAVILAGNAWVTPMYNLRYTSFCAPAVALLMAAGLRGLTLLAQRRAAPWRWVPVAGIALVLLAAAPGYVVQRTPFAKDDGADFRQVAELVAANAAPGDGIVFDAKTKPSQRPRLALNLYPDRFAGLDDVALRRPYTARAALWDSVFPIADVAAPANGHRRIWVVESRSHRTDVDALLRLGFTVERSLPAHRTTIYELVKQ